jgi:hypothetical protein
MTSKIEHQSMYPTLVSKEVSDLSNDTKQSDLGKKKCIQLKNQKSQKVNFSFIFSENPLYKIGALREHFPVSLSLKIWCVACYDIQEWD